MEAHRARYEEIQGDCTFRAELWRQFVATYQDVLEDAPESFSQFCSDFREQYLRGQSSC